MTASDLHGDHRLHSGVKGAGRLVPARLRPADVPRVAAAGLRARPLRVFLSALGIAIGIAAMVAVVGISTSSRADLQATLQRLGTNLLTVAPGEMMFDEGTAALPPTAEAMIGRIDGVTSVSAIGTVSAKVYRTDKIPRGESGGLSVRAARIGLPTTLGATVASGSWLNPATDRHPAVVLGSKTAHQLGITTAGPDIQIYVGGQWFTVVGILDPIELTPELDYAAFVGWDAATTYLNFDGNPSTVYTRSRESAVTTVQGLLAATANPANPNEVKVSRPSDALAAAAAADNAFTNLLLGLGAVALLVGGVGVANTMVISVLERRGEIGLRRSLGATRGQIRLQFFVESLLLSALGGAGGVLLGITATAAYATNRGWPTVVPAWVVVGGVGATLVIGAIAGLYPAIRAARLAPTEALAAP